MSNTVKGNRSFTSGSSPYNAQEFLVSNWVQNNVNTALPVRVVGVETTGPGMTGFVDVIPLIQGYDGFGNAIKAVTIYKVPYSRIQGGIAALVIDPIVGDIGIAIFAQQDITNVNDKEQKPLTRRSFSMADAMYLGGIRNQEPTIYVELTQENVCNIIAPEKVYIKTSACEVECDTAVVKASESITEEAGQSITLKAPQITAYGNFTNMGYDGGTGSVVMTANIELKGDIDQTGEHTSTGDQVAGGISQISHVHGGVVPGGGDTSTPK